MGVFVGVFIVFFGVVALMSVGVLLGRKPITGSCGGVGAALGEPNYNCDICGGDMSKCEEQNELVASEDLNAELGVDVSNQSKK